MFFFRKNKPALQELIPNGYVDIHSHVIPGIDDGAKTASDSALLLQKMKGFGFAEVIGTPHIIQGIWDNSYDSIQTVFEEHHAIWHQSGMHLSAAAEYMMDSEFSNLLQEGKLRSLKDNFILVEMSYINPPIQLYKILFDLQVAGYQPVLAHPERYLFYHKSLEEYKKLINAGCLLQLNLLSLTGYYGSKVAEVADYLLRNTMYSFSGSDIHHENHVKSFGQKLLLSDSKMVSDLLERNSFFSRQP